MIAKASAPYVQMCEIFRDEPWLRRMKEAPRDQDTSIRIKTHLHPKAKTPLSRLELFCELCYN